MREKIEGPSPLHSKFLNSLLICVLLFPPNEKILECIDDIKKIFLSVGTRERRAEVKEKTGKGKLWG